MTGCGPRTRRTVLSIAALFVAAALLVPLRPDASRAVSPVEAETTLYGVAATASSNAWAVGSSSGRRTLIERWNGTAWKRQSSLNPGRTLRGALYENELFGVAATSRSNAWAVGDYYRGGGARRTLVERWGGSGWKIQRSPNPIERGVGSNRLFAVAAMSASNAWAVGNYERGRVNRSLILHWNGSAWKVQKSPNVVPACSCLHYNVLYGVAATSPSNAWAVGYYRSNVPMRSGAVIEHWNGSAWTVQKTIPSTEEHFAVLRAIAAVSPSDAWAVGEVERSPQFPESTARTLILHYNGTAWLEQQSPNPSDADRYPDVYLNGVTATSPSNAWAVGRTGALRTFILHWNGTGWEEQKSPNPGAKSDTLQGVAATSAADAWAVGQYTYNRRGTFFDRPLLQRWNGMAWK